MGTPDDRIVRELEEVPPRDQLNVVVEVMRRLGMTSGARQGFLGRTGKMWATAGLFALALGLGILVAHLLIDDPYPRRRCFVGRASGSGSFSAPIRRNAASAARSPLSQAPSIVPHSVSWVASPAR